MTGSDSTGSQRGRQQVGAAVGDDDDLDAALRVGRRAERALVQAEVGRGHLGPRGLCAPAPDPRRDQLVARRASSSSTRLISAVASASGVAGRDQQRRRRRPRRAGRRCRWRRPGRRRPSPRRRRGRTARASRASAATARRARRGRGRSRAAAPGSSEPTSSTRSSRPELGDRARGAASSSGPAPATRSVARRRAGRRPRGARRRPCGARAGRRTRRRGPRPAGPTGPGEKRSVSTPSGIRVAAPGKPLALADAAGLGVADAQPGGVAQRPPLEPAERRRVALVDVLGGVQDVRRPLAAQPPQQQDLGGRQGERLLVDVDDVVRPAEGAPQRQRRVDEQRRVASPGAEAGHRLARTGRRGPRRSRPRSSAGRSAGRPRRRERAGGAPAPATRRRRRCGRFGGPAFPSLPAPNTAPRLSLTGQTDWRTAIRPRRPVRAADRENGVCGVKLRDFLLVLRTRWLIVVGVHRWSSPASRRR